MSYARPGDTVEFVLRAAPPGQAANLAIALRRLSTNTILTSRPAGQGIAEQDPGGTTSNYTGTITVPVDAPEGTYQGEFSDASGTYPDEELLRVTASGQAPAIVGPFYVDPATVRRALDPTSDGTAATADPGTAAVMSDDELNVAIADAQSEVNSKVPAAPFTGTVPDLVVNVTRDIAAYVATMTHRKGDPMTVDDPVRLRYGRARGLLDDLARGRAEVGGEGGADAAAAAVVNPYDGDLFTLGDLALGPGPRNGPAQDWQSGMP